MKTEHKMTIIPTKVRLFSFFYFFNIPNIFAIKMDFIYSRQSATFLRICCSHFFRIFAYF